MWEVNRLLLGVMLMLPTQIGMLACGIGLFALGVWYWYQSSRLARENALLTIECERLEKLSVKNLVQLEVRWLDSCGHEAEWSTVMTRQFYEAFLTQLREHLTWAKMRAAEWRLPEPFAYVTNKMVTEVKLYRLGGAQWREMPGVIDFEYHECVWRRTRELVRSLAEDLSPHKGAQLTVAEFALLVGEDVPLDIAERWLNGQSLSCADMQKFKNLRECLDAIAAHWKYDAITRINRIARFKDYDHPTPFNFARGMLLGTTTPVLELLKSEEGTKQVMDHILANNDLPKEEPKEAASGTAS